MAGEAAAACAYSGKSIWWIGKAAFFVIGSYVFSYIFWNVKQRVECKKPKKRKK